MATLRSREPFILLCLWLATLVLSGIAPKERLTWVLEVVPVLAATHGRHPLTPLLYRLIFLHGLILMLGGHYTYAETPLGFWAQEAFDWSRNHYNRLGHFAQGFVPTMIAREILRRTTPLRPGGLLGTLAVSVALAISALYELAEWGAALVLGQGADAFLGTQGDPWDTQADMFLALLGALCAQIALSHRHEKELARLGAGA